MVKKKQTSQGNLLQIYTQNPILSKWFLKIGNRFLNFIDKIFSLLFNHLKNRTLDYCLLS